MSAQAPTTTTTEHSPAVRAFAALLRAHSSATRLLSVQLHAEHGLTINDYEALVVLSGSEGRRLKRVDLARRLMLTPSGVTRLLEGLEEAGLVERASCKEDLRVTYAQLTEAGAEKLDQASCGHVGSIRTLLEEHLSEEELDLLVVTLGKLPGVAQDEPACIPD